MSASNRSAKKGARVQTVKFTQMKEGDKADYDLLNAHETEYASHTATRLLDALESLDT